MIQLFDADDSPALGKPVATHEWTLFTLADNQFALFALVTLDAGGLGGRFGRKDVTLFIQLERCFAFGIIAASQESSESALLIYHGLAAVRTLMLADLFFDHFPVLVTGTGEGALRIRRATQEFTVFAEPVNKGFTALWTVIITGRDFRFGVFHFGLRGFEAFLEWTVEFFQHAEPVEVLLFDFVELLFHEAGKGNIHDLREVLAQLFSDDLTEVGGVKLLFPLIDISPLLNGTDDRRIGTGPADPFFFERLDQ